MTSALRSDEKAVVNTRPESDASFQRQLAMILNSSQEKKPSPTPRKQQNTNEVVQKRSEAFTRNQEISQSQWLKKRGLIELKEELTSSKDIFSMLDTSKVGHIPSKDFLDFLIEIGIPIDRSMAKKVILSTFKKKTLKNFSLTQENVNSLCKSDNRSNQMLAVFNEKLGKNFKTIEIVDLIQKWWNSLGSKVQSLNSICEFLVKNSIFNDFSEAKKYLTKLNSNENFLVYRQFLSIFSKMIVKHCLITINKKFNEEDWKDSGFSRAYKLCQLKKQMILAGIKYPVAQVSQEEGMHTLKAVEKLEKFRFEKKFNFDEFKKNWFDLTGCIIDNQVAIKPQNAEKTVERPISVFYSAENYTFRSEEDQNFSDPSNKNMLVRSVYKAPAPSESLPSFQSPNKKKRKNLTQEEQKIERQARGLEEFQRLIEN